MAHFVFRLQALQKLREHHRDQCREELARILAEDQALIQQRAELEQNRLHTMEDLTARLAADRVAVAEVTALRQYIGWLQSEMRQVDRQRAEVAERITIARQKLVGADQNVKVLEKLDSRQREEYEKELEKRSSREREEIWQAGHWHSR